MPWPVPLPTSLVVKKGSNIRCIFDRGIPAPVSLMLICTKSSPLFVPIAILPFPDPFPVSWAWAIAWAELTIIFRTTWLISSITQSTGGRSGCRSSSRSAMLFHSFLEIVTVPSMALLISAQFLFLLPEWEKSFIARTSLLTRAIPASAWRSPRKSSAATGARSAPGTTRTAAPRSMYGCPRRVVRKARPAKGVAPCLKVRFFLAVKVIDRDGPLVVR